MLGLIIIIFGIISLPDPKDSKTEPVETPTFIKYNLTDTWYEEIMVRCNKTDVVRTSGCVVEFVQKFFNYTDDKCRNANYFDKLLTNGGNCCSWTNFYFEVMKDLNFNVKKVRYFNYEGLNSSGHVMLFTWAKDDMDYCVIDQETYWCHRIGE